MRKIRFISYFLLPFLIINSGKLFAGGSTCVTVSSITCNLCNASGDIANQAGPVTVKFCVTISYLELGVNWIHGVYVNGVKPGFSMATMVSGGAPTGSDGVGNWIYMPAPAFTSTNSGNLITTPGWYYDRTIDGNPGNNLGDSGPACDPCNFTFCFDITTRTCAALGNVDTPGSMTFGFMSDSYSGSWTDVTCGLETPGTSYNYTVKCCAVVANAGPDQTICAGQNATLTAAAGGTTYSWAPGGATTASISVSPASTTTYTVTVGNGTCTNTDDVIVNVSTFTVSAGANQTICASTATTPLSGSYSNAVLNVTNTVYNANPNVAIPDNNAGGVNSTIASAIAGGTVAQVCVTVNHTWNDDIDLKLTCPGGGTTIDLSSDNGSSGDNYTNACFTRTAGSNVNTLAGVVTSPITGNWLPEQALSLLDGCASNGNWVLNASDDANFITGTLASWSITIAQTSPPTILWSPATNLSATNVLNPTFTNPGPGTYTYTLSVTDNVCTKTSTVTITVTSPTLVTSVTNASTCAASDGSINLTPSSGTPGYTYIWSNGSSVQDPTGLATGTYTVTVTDSKGCTATTNATVSCTPSTCVTVTSITCNVCDGSGNIDNNAGPVTVRFCVSISYLELGVNWIHGVYVNGVKPGFSMATMTGGGAPTGSDGVGTWLYMPAPAFTSVNSGNLITTPGWYYDRTIDGNPGNNLGDSGPACDPCNFTFCYDITTRTCAALGWVDTPGSMTFGFMSDSYSGSWTDVTCGLETPGFAYNYTVKCCNVVADAGADKNICAGQSTTLTAAAGPTTFSWAPGGATTQSITVSPGVTTTYTLTVGNGTCTRTDQVIVNVSTLTVNAGTDQTICATTPSTALSGSYAGAILNPVLTVYNANPNITITDNKAAGVNSTIASATAGGTVSQVCVNITHAWNEDLDIILTCPGGGTTIGLSSDNGGSGDNYTNACFTRTAGSNISTLGGVNTSPITGNWLPEQALSLLDGCASNGNWVLNVADDASLITGTLTSWSITIATPSTPTILWSPATNLSATNVLNPTFTNPGPGTYTYTLSVTDNVCTQTDVITITVTSPTLSTVVTNATCGLSNGAINLTVASGTPGYTYNWSNAATVEDISALAAGNYTVTVTDSKSCTSTRSATVTAGLVPTLSTVVTDVSCPGGSNGAINLTVASGTAPFSYLWSNAATTEDLTTLSAGTYTVTVSDAATCTATTSAVVAQPAAITTSIVLQTNVVCPCDASGALDISVAGGTPVYSYAWSNLATTQDITGVLAGVYTVTVTDSKSCTKSSSFTITEPAPITITLNSQTNADCYGVCNGTINAQAAGGLTPYDYSNDGGTSYLFNNIVSGTPVNFTSLCAGTYKITIRDANNCITP